MTSGPTINRHNSKQDYGTPRNFLDAVVKEFGSLDWDLAASVENKKAPQYFGPGSKIAENTLTTTLDGMTGNMWCNPPYANIGDWAKHFAETRLRSGANILFLVPASIGSNWFAKYVHGKALVLALNGRLTFEGCSKPFPKDCILAVYGYQPGFEVWKWNT